MTYFGDTLCLASSYMSYDQDFHHPVTLLHACACVCRKMLITYDSSTGHLEDSVCPS
jgi:hypothetical protein